MDVAGYLSRIGAGPEDDLATLMRRHLETVPFENLSVHFRETITLTPSALVDKVVERRRGGFCYELNGAFAWLLGELGRDVTLCSARVWTGHGYSAPGDHLTLIVDGQLVDVGFGRFALAPLDLRVRSEAVGYGLRDAPDGELDVVLDGSPVFRVDLRARSLDDFVPLAWFHRTSPDSIFTRSLTCSRRTADGRVTLSGDQYIETPDHGERTEKTLSEPEQLEVYREVFGIALDAVPPVLNPA